MSCTWFLLYLSLIRDLIQCASFREFRNSNPNLIWNKPYRYHSIPNLIWKNSVFTSIVRSARYYTSVIHDASPSHDTKTRLSGYETQTADWIGWDCLYHAIWVFHHKEEHNFSMLYPAYGQCYRLFQEQPELIASTRLHLETLPRNLSCSVKPFLFVYEQRAIHDRLTWRHHFLKLRQSICDCWFCSL